MKFSKYLLGWGSGFVFLLVNEEHWNLVILIMTFFLNNNEKLLQ